MLYQANEVIKNINREIDEYHRTNQVVIFIQHIDEDMPIFSENWQLINKLHNQQNDTYFNKYYPDAFFETDLNDFLLHQKVDEVEIAGVQTEYCIDTTIRVAFHMGYHVSILDKGFSTFDTPLLSAQQINQHHLKIWQGSFAEVVKADEL